MTTRDLTPDDLGRLSDLLLEAEEILERGGEPSPVELCRNHPHLLVEFTRKLTALRATQWLNRPLDSKPSTGTESGDSVHLQRNMVLAGRYRLEQRIGQGGHCQVWRAWDMQLGRAVALKLPKAASEKADEAMVAEARRIAGLKHPGIVQIHDVGQDGNIRFIVTDLVEGGSLADLPEGAYSRDQILKWMAEVADALDYAHRMGIIHRDIKPSNILLDHHGRALLADFGISRSISDQADGAGQNTFSGTLRYMAPEQVLGQSTTPQSDIHAVGVMLHELLTGKLPYRENKGSDPVALRSQIISGERHLDENLTGAIRKVCLRAMDLDPARRYPSGRAMALEIRECLRWKPGFISWAALTALLGLLGAGALIILSNDIGLKNSKPSLSVTRPMEKTWLEQVRSLDPAGQVAAVVEALKQRNPGFDGVVETLVDKDRVKKLKLCTDFVSDIAPIAALTELEEVALNGTYTSKRNGILSDISPLQGMRLKRFECYFNDSLTSIEALRGMPLELLQCSSNGVSDLSPIAGAPIRELWSGGTPLKSLEPLRGMPLEIFWCSQTKVVDLSPLAGAPLKHLRCQDTRLASLEPLSGCPLETMECHRTEISSVEPLRGMKTLQVLNIHSTRVTDLSPLLECKSLSALWCTIVPERDDKVLSQMKWLKHLNDNALTDYRFRIP